jgi:hypothetical protein
MRHAFTNHAEQEVENWIVDHDSKPSSYWHCQYRYLSDNVQPSICLLAHSATTYKLLGAYKSNQCRAYLGVYVGYLLYYENYANEP